jgi:hypothetical protein
MRIVFLFCDTPLKHARFTTQGQKPHPKYLGSQKTAKFGVLEALTLYLLNISTAFNSPLLQLLMEKVKKPWSACTFERIVQKFKQNTFFCKTVGNRIMGLYHTEISFSRASK